MTETAMLELQRWSEEVARDPASPAFLSLARAYRRQGQRDAALHICLRALEREPTHVEGHALLALLFLEAGEREKASDAWSAILRLDPDHFEAHRGLGFVYLERREYEAARRHLERAAQIRPEDPAVRDALELAIGAMPSAGPGSARSGSAAGARPAPAAPSPNGSAAHATMRRDPTRVFEPLLGDTAFLGALVLDIQGLVLAGTLALGGRNRAERLGAVLGEAVEEAARIAGFLGIGAWRGVLLQTDAALVHITPLKDGLTLVVAGTPDAPAGWMLRASARAAELAQAYVREMHD